MIHAAHLRAARALLDWRQEDLSREANVGLATIHRLEKGDGPLKANVSTAIKLQSAFERAGIRFLDKDDEGGIGVRLRE